jgi:transcriptional regulator with XRE-family HTH domain
MTRRCEGCHAVVSRYSTEPVCPTCYATANRQPTPIARRGLPPALWLWSGPEAAKALATRDLGVILRVYRRLNGLSQDKLAVVLGYDKTYVSMIETGRRVINDVATRRQIADTLALPAHALGITNADDVDFRAMIQFADSTIRLAEIARQAGRVVEAVNELWPLVARLEARAAEGRIERETLLLLGQARLALGVSLGTVLPEERLVTAAHWTSKALVVAERLDDQPFLAQTLRMHGNELRKADRVRAGVARLQHAAHLSETAEDRGTALALLARAAGEDGNAELFDQALDGYRGLLDTGRGRSMLFNPFTFREIELRGLVSTDRAQHAMRIIHTGLPDAAPVAPQWHIIERVTAGQVLLAGGQPDEAEDALRMALTAAEISRLPHQIQRTIRAAELGHLLGVADEGRAALDRLNMALASGLPDNN